jgi:hypothetical protein
MHLKILTQFSCSEIVVVFTAKIKVENDVFLLHQLLRAHIWSICVDL